MLYTIITGDYELLCRITEMKREHSKGIRLCRSVPAKNLNIFLTSSAFFNKLILEKVRAFSTNFTVVRHKKTVKVLLHYGKT